MVGTLRRQGKRGYWVAVPWGLHPLQPNSQSQHATASSVDPRCSGATHAARRRHRFQHRATVALLHHCEPPTTLRCPSIGEAAPHEQPAAGLVHRTFLNKNRRFNESKRT
jgi:hypothetical protein